MAANTKTPRSTKRVSKNTREIAQQSPSMTQTGGRLDTKFFAGFVKTMNPVAIRQMTRVIEKENATRQASAA